MIVGLEAMPPPPPSRGSGNTFGILEPGEILTSLTCCKLVFYEKFEITMVFEKY